MRSSPGGSGRSDAEGGTTKHTKHTKMKAWLRSGMLSAGVVLWVMAGAGCLSVPIPQAEADPSRFYVLNPVTAPLTAGAEATKAPAMTLQPVEVASYLRSRPLIVRRGENEIQFREFARWGEPLELGIARVLREELLARGAASEVRTGVVGKGDVALAVRVLACEGGADGSVFFRAVWELTRRS